MLSPDPSKPDAVVSTLSFVVLVEDPELNLNPPTGLLAHSLADEEGAFDPKTNVGLGEEAVSPNSIFSICVSIKVR